MGLGDVGATAEALVAELAPEPSFFWLAIKRLSVELNRFFTWLSVRPGIEREMTAHLFP